MFMTVKEMFVYARTPADRVSFVGFWAGLYQYPEEEKYLNNIDGPHTHETLRELFEWEMGKRFLRTQFPNVKCNFIDRMKEARYLPEDISAADFLDQFPLGGPIYRIFWIHCWQPNRFPIYDQHVHRAMTYLEDGKPEELKSHNALRSYLRRYLPFHQQFKGLDQRQVDRALWTFGKHLKSQNPLRKLLGVD